MLIAKGPLQRSLTPNDYTILAFDPGGTTGWAHLTLTRHAYSRPENKILSTLQAWDCGELQGSEHEQLEQAQSLLLALSCGTFNHRSNVISEDFELTQLVGGRNLLSPVRINAVLAWLCTTYGRPFHLQKRSMRTLMTHTVVRTAGFRHRFAKDEFAAMQHALTWARRMKQESLTAPWGISTTQSHNDHWDCTCAHGAPCDMVHPR